MPAGTAAAKTPQDAFRAWNRPAPAKPAAGTDPAQAEALKGLTEAVKGLQTAVAKPPASAPATKPPARKRAAPPAEVKTLDPAKLEQMGRQEFTAFQEDRFRAHLAVALEPLTEALGRLASDAGRASIDRMLDKFSAAHTDYADWEDDVAAYLAERPKLAQMGEEGLELALEAVKKANPAKAAELTAASQASEDDYSMQPGGLSDVGGAEIPEDATPRDVASLLYRSYRVDQLG